MSRREYRVGWQRAGHAKKRALYQTLEGATRCAQRQESAAAEMTWLTSPLPELAGRPVIESREVGEWEAVAWQT